MCIFWMCFKPQWDLFLTQQAVVMLVELWKQIVSRRAKLNSFFIFIKKQIQSELLCFSSINMLTCLCGHLYRSLEDAVTGVCFTSETSVSRYTLTALNRLSAAAGPWRECCCSHWAYICMHAACIRINECMFTQGEHVLPYFFASVFPSPSPTCVHIFVVFCECGAFLLWTFLSACVC